MPDFSATQAARRKLQGAGETECGPTQEPAQRTTPHAAQNASQIHPQSREVAAHVRKLGMQFLVHSFLYYRLGESLISDEAFDHIANALYRLHEKDATLPLPYAKTLLPALGPEASALGIRSYPAPVVTVAFQLLYAHAGVEEDFAAFAARKGYRVYYEDSAGSVSPAALAPPGRKP